MVDLTSTGNTTINTPVTSVSVPVGAGGGSATGNTGATGSAINTGNTAAPTVTIPVPVTSGNTGTPGATVPVTVTSGSNGTTVSALGGTTTLPVGASSGAGGTTVSTPAGNVTVPVGVSSGTGGTTVTTPVGTVTLPVGVSTGPGGTTITTPVGPVTVPIGGTVTLPGIGGGGTTISASAGGSSTMITTSPSGATTTQTIPSGSTIATGTGLAAGDVVTISPSASYNGAGQFTIGGHVAAGSGVSKVTISAVIDGAASSTVLGTATVAADGSYSFVDNVGSHLQGFITATATDGLGATTSVQSPYSLQAGLRGGYKAEQDLYTPSGDAEVALTHYKADGSRFVDIKNNGQTFQSDTFDTFANGGAPDNTFVFNPGHGLDIISQFRANGTDHDTLSFKGVDFNNDIAAVLQNTKSVKGGAVITDPATGDTVKLVGVSKKELVANPSDFAFHA